MSETLTAERLAEMREKTDAFIKCELAKVSVPIAEFAALLDAAEENGRLNNRLIEIHREAGESVNNPPSPIDAFRMLKADRDAALAQLAEWREVAESQAEAIRKHIVQGRLGLPTITDDAMARSANKSYALSEKYPKEASK